MSLFKDVSSSLSGQGLNNVVAGGADAITSGIGSGIKQAFGGGQFGDAIASLGVGMARNAALGVYNKYVPIGMQRAANTASGAIGDILNGDIGGAGLRVLDSGLLRDFLPGGMDSIASQARYWGSPTPLFGGLTPMEARQIYNDSRGVSFCRKNLWLIEVKSNLMGDISSRFNLFALELDYAPYTTSGEKRKIGGAHADIVNSSDPVELRITVMDDENGFIKNWFVAHSKAAAGKDGTVGLPDQYAISIRIVHGFIGSNAGNMGGYEDIGQFRPANIEISLSRREDGLQELQLSFVQLDTFI
jgi:hypothetical protein